MTQGELGGVRQEPPTGGCTEDWRCTCIDPPLRALSAQPFPGIGKTLLPGRFSSPVPIPDEPVLLGIQAVAPPPAGGLLGAHRPKGKSKGCPVAARRREAPRGEGRQAAAPVPAVGGSLVRVGQWVSPKGSVAAGRRESPTRRGEAGGSAAACRRAPWCASTKG